MSAEYMTGHPDAPPEIVEHELIVADPVPSLSSVPCLLRDGTGTRPGLVVTMATDHIVRIVMFIYVHHEWVRLTDDDDYAIIWPATLNGGA